MDSELEYFTSSGPSLAVIMEQFIDNIWMYYTTGHEVCPGEVHDENVSGGPVVPVYVDDQDNGVSNYTNDHQNNHQYDNGQH